MGISYRGKYRWFGQYKTEKQAAMAYDKEARRLHGRYAQENFPGGGAGAAEAGAAGASSTPRIRRMRSGKIS